MSKSISPCVSMLDLASPSPTKLRIPASQGATLRINTPRTKPPDPQPTTDALSKFGIKVKDFAYESTLPPIQPWRRQQVQPGLETLKRKGVDYPEGQPGTKRVNLGRERTEPDLAAGPSNTPFRAQGFYNFSGAGSSMDFGGYSQPSRFSSPCHSQSPIYVPSHSQSQESEPYVVTPLVTPNGSLDWGIKINNQVGSSQLDQQSQEPPALVSYEQLGFEPPPEIQSQQEDELPSSHKPPNAVTPHHSSPIPPSPSPAEKQRRPPTRAAQVKAARPVLVTPPLPIPPASRYHLRSRALADSKQAPTASTSIDRPSNNLRSREGNSRTCAEAKAKTGPAKKPIRKRTNMPPPPVPAPSKSRATTTTSRKPTSQRQLQKQAAVAESAMPPAVPTPPKSLATTSKKPTSRRQLQKQAAATESNTVVPPVPAPKNLATTASKKPLSKRQLEKQTNVAEPNSEPPTKRPRRQIKKSGE